MFRENPKRSDDSKLNINRANEETECSSSKEICCVQNKICITQLQGLKNRLQVSSSPNALLPSFNLTFNSQLFCPDFANPTLILLKMKTMHVAATKLATCILRSITPFPSPQLPFNATEFPVTISLCWGTSTKLLCITLNRDGTTPIHHDSELRRFFLLFS